MSNRIFNFSAGPATLPLEVLKKAQDELTDYHGIGMSVMEISHRSPEYSEINEATQTLMKEIMGIGDDYKVLFVGGGASTQFDILPLNFLTKDTTAAYVDTGAWSSKAIKEAKQIGNVHLAGSGKDINYTKLPTLDEIAYPNDAAYLHMTSNNTIHGTQYFDFPDTGNVPLICDMSSDILSHTMDYSKFSLMYAGAQKNLGPAGVTIIVVRKSLLEKCNEGLLTMLSLKTHADKDSLYNTPPVFPIYIVRLVLEWIKAMGGLEAVEKHNIAKKDCIYRMMELHPDYYRGTADLASRSWMNITWRLPSEELEKKFIAEAKAAGFSGLKGHRSVGGVRASVYNSMPLEGTEKLAEFMETFKKNN